MSGPGGTHHDVLIVGGGNAGISLAARLLRYGARNVAIIEPSDTHTYQPLLSYVGGGSATVEEAQRPMGRVIPHGCTWHRDAALAVDPARREVRTASGAAIGYGDVVVCPGATPAWDAVPGSFEAVHSPYASTNYLPELAPKTWRLIREMRSGRAVFTVPDRPVPCGGVAYKPLFLACDHWRRTGVLDAIEVVALVQAPTMFGLPDVDRALEAAAADYGVEVRTGTSLHRIRADDRVLETTAHGSTEEMSYDLLHLTPEHRAAGWIADSGLAEARGFVDVDPHTLQHRRHQNVWATGDAAETASSRSGGALRKQVPVLAHNIAAARVGAQLQRYDGYSVAPITTSRTRLLLAEFDRSGALQPTLGIHDLRTPRPWTYAFDRWLQPQIYWHGILRGRA